MRVAFRRLKPFAVMVTVALMLVGAVGETQAQTPAPAPAPSQSQGPAAPLYPDYRLPDTITLCGETIPLDDRDVYESMDYEFLLAVHGRFQVYLWLRRAGRYFPYIEKRLAEEGLPDDLKYLAVAESDLRVTAKSRSAAMGTWQFMEYTGRRYGLKKDEDFDERLNFEKSTEAAILYLKKLYAMFGKWSLAMAAYNCGEGCVGKAIKEQEVNSYYRLSLPAETERYVYRIAAIKLILRDPRKYGYAMDPGLAYPALKADRVPVDLGKAVGITQVAKAIGADYKAIKDLNPEIRGTELPAGIYDLYVPAGLGQKLSAFLKTEAPAEVSKPVKTTDGKKAPDSYVVQRGDTLNSVAQRTGVPVDTIRRLNNIKGSHIWVGQDLKLQP